MNPIDELKAYVESEIAKTKLDAQILTVEAVIAALSEKLNELKDQRSKL